MNSKIELNSIALSEGALPVLGPDQALLGPQFLPHQHLLLYSAEAWEEFVQEWAHYCLKAEYHQVQRFSGAGDMGVDVAGFTDQDMLVGVWDNYQCKHYDKPLGPGEGLSEIGKMLWYAFNQAFKAPRHYYFAAPKGVGTTLGGLLANSSKLKHRLFSDWGKYCASKITKEPIPLTGAFLEFVEAFDFKRFRVKTGLQLVEMHKAKCPLHVARFGGGLPGRPTAGSPPSQIAPIESRYVEQLLNAYTEHAKQPVAAVTELTKWPKLRDHFSRQRVAFYHAESLRVFARDTVPAGTFEALQEDIFTGVVDIHDATHGDGYAKVCEVTKAARDLQLTSNVLLIRSKPADRDGICHQLANEDRLKWTDK